MSRKARTAKTPHKRGPPPISSSRSRISYPQPIHLDNRTNLPGRRQYHHSQWVVFTATERAYQPRPFPIPAARLRGSRPLPSRSSSRSPSLRRRAPLPPSMDNRRRIADRNINILAGLVRSYVILTVSPRPRVSFLKLFAHRRLCANTSQSLPATRSSVFSSPTVWLPAPAEAHVNSSSALEHLPRYTNLPLLVQS